MDFLTDAWLREFASNHTMLLGALPVIAYAILRLIATMNPNVPTNLVRDLLMNLGVKDKKGAMETTPRVEPEVKL